MPVGADESCHDRASLDTLRGLYDVVILKLDKTGGLTEAHAMGFRVMAVCMVGASLGMAPAMLHGPGADHDDLDGPLLLAEDRPCGLRYDGSVLHPPRPRFWG